MIHESLILVCRRTRTALASTPRALRRLPVSDPRLRLVRTLETAASVIGLVLLDDLPGLLDAPGAGALADG